jgi:hypothetical protein
VIVAKLHKDSNTLSIRRVSRTVQLVRTGRRGPQGDAGENGEGVPTGGTAGQILSKLSPADFDVDWVDPEASSSAVWGAITGTLADQTDLQTVLDGKASAATLSAHIANTSNPHSVTKTQVGLGNVDNTSDLAKPVSTATQSALNLKADTADLATVATTGDYDDLINKPTIPTSASSIGGLLIANNLSDVASVATARTNLGLGTTDSPTFADLDVSTLDVAGVGTAEGTTLRASTTQNLTYNKVFTALVPNLSNGNRAQFVFGRDKDSDNQSAEFTFTRDASNSRVGIGIHGNAGAFIINYAGNVGLSTSSPTHTLTLPSTSTGIAIYKTSDQTTNFERLRKFWDGNQATIATEAGGTGTVRNLSIGTANRRLVISDTASSSGYYQFGAGLGNTTNAVMAMFNPTLLASSTVSYGVAINPVVQETNTAGYTALLINPTETSTGSGAKLLIDAQVSGVSKFKVSNAGKVTATGGIVSRVGTVASSATPSINADLYDQFNITALATDITSMSTNLTGTLTDGQKLMIRFKDDGTPRTIAWGASFVSSGIATLLATTVANKTHMVGLVYDAAATKWVCMAVDATGY